MSDDKSHHHPIRIQLQALIVRQEKLVAQMETDRQLEKQLQQQLDELAARRLGQEEELQQLAKEIQGLKEQEPSSSGDARIPEIHLEMPKSAPAVATICFDPEIFVKDWTYTHSECVHTEYTTKSRFSQGNHIEIMTEKAHTSQNPRPLLRTNGRCSVEIECNSGEWIKILAVKSEGQEKLSGQLTRYLEKTPKITTRVTDKAISIVGSMFSRSKVPANTATKGYAHLRYSLIYAIDDKIHQLQARFNWSVSVLPVLKGTLVSYELPASLDEFFTDSRLKPTQASHVDVQITEEPFAKGAEWQVLHGQNLSDPENPVKILLKKHKIYQHKSTLYTEAIRPYTAPIQMHAISAYLVSEFNDGLRKTTAVFWPISIWKTQLLSCMDPASRDWQCCLYKECYTAGSQHLRFTSDTNDAMLKETATTKGIDIDTAFIEQLLHLFPAFSHWSFQFSSARLMVADLKGLISIGTDGQSGNILLNDPTIYSTNDSRGEEGMDAFFQSHKKCNDICHKLGLRAYQSDSEMRGNEPFALRTIM